MGATTIHHGTASELIREGKPFLLGLNEINDLIWAIQLAFSRIDEDIETFKGVASALGEGQSIPLFAEGKAGMAAADRIIDSFVDGKARITALLELLNSCDEMIAVEAL